MKQGEVNCSESVSGRFGVQVTLFVAGGNCRLKQSCLRFQCTFSLLSWVLVACFGLTRVKLSGVRRVGDLLVCCAV